MRWTVWTIHADGTGLTRCTPAPLNTWKIIAGHEFFSAMAHDLVRPANSARPGFGCRYQVSTGNAPGITCNATNGPCLQRIADGTLVCRDGGTRMVRRRPDGNWIYLFRPSVYRTWRRKAANSDNDDTGSSSAERCVKHEQTRYRLEPNVTFRRT